MNECVDALMHECRQGSSLNDDVSETAEIQVEM